MTLFCLATLVYSSSSTATPDLCRMLDDMSHDAENTDSRLKALTARVDKVSKKLGGQL